MQCLFFSGSLGSNPFLSTDASTDAPTTSGFRLGIWIARDDQIPVSSIDVPQAVVDKWVPRRTYINLLELLAVPLLAFSALDILRGRDILWFLDNQAAWRAIIRSASSPSRQGWMDPTVVAIQSGTWTPLTLRPCGMN